MCCNQHNVHFTLYKCQFYIYLWRCLCDDNTLSFISVMNNLPKIIVFARIGKASLLCGINISVCITRKVEALKSFPLANTNACFGCFCLCFLRKWITYSVHTYLLRVFVTKLRGVLRSANISWHSNTNNAWDLLIYVICVCRRKQ